MNNQFKNVSDELMQEAPILASLPKPKTFDVPAGYFEVLEQQLLEVTMITQTDRREVDQELEGYFDNLEDAILSKVSINEAKIVDISAIKKSSANINLWKYAAAFVVGIMLVGIAINTQSTSDNVEALAVQNTEYLDYVLDNIDDFDLNTMIDEGLITEADLDLTIIQFNESYKDNEVEEFFDSEIDF